MLPAEHAEATILSLVEPFTKHDTEIVSVLNARGRILAEAIASPLDFPHWDSSAMDGYAVRSEDVKTASPDEPVTLTIVEEIPAGVPPQHSIAAGQAARIFTGAMIPTGADTVVIQEVTQREGDRVLIQASPQLNAFLRKQGTYAQAGDLLLPQGCPLGAAEVAILAAAQCPQIAVFRRPRVAILSTGDELVPIDRPLQPGQIVDSNRYALAALIAQVGGEPVLMDSVPDQPAALKDAIAQSMTIADVIISSGGVSVGDYDYVDQILADLGATIHIRSVAVKPGKPLTVATLSKVESRLQPPDSVTQSPEAAPNPAPSPHILYFGLPGNPVSALVTFWRFVVPALRKLSGLPQPWQPSYVNAIAHQLLKPDTQRECYVWGRVEQNNGNYTFVPAEGSQTSGNLINLAGTNGLAVVPLGDTEITSGEIVKVLLMS